MTPRELLDRTAGSWNLVLSATQLDQFEHYLATLLRFNQHTNLTAITDPHAIVERHFLDSLALARAWDAPPASLVDIGAGAGFPGLPLKILWPELRLLLSDSVGKKATFMRIVADELALRDVETTTRRAEELGRDVRYREQFAAATARAVAPLNVLAEYCLPLIATGGVWIAPKSAAIDDELAAARPAIATLGGGDPRIVAVDLPTAAPRLLVVVPKLHNTSPAFPRRVGVPSKRPL